MLGGVGRQGESVDLMRVWVVEKRGMLTWVAHCVQAWPSTGGIAGLKVVARLRLPAEAALASLAAAAGLLGRPGLLLRTAAGSAGVDTTVIGNGFCSQGKGGGGGSVFVCTVACRMLECRGRRAWNSLLFCANTCSAQLRG